MHRKRVLKSWPEVFRGGGGTAENFRALNLNENILKLPLLCPNFINKYFLPFKFYERWQGPFVPPLEHMLGYGEKKCPYINCKYIII